MTEEIIFFRSEEKCFSVKKKEIKSKRHNFAVKGRGHAIPIYCALKVY